MGTASTMACIAEALGMVPLGHGSIPAVHADRLRAAEEAGALAVKLIASPIRPSEIITAASVENALRVLLALGGSTNALIHLTAIAGRRGVSVDLHRLNELSDTTPVLVDLKPTGEGYMEDFHAAGRHAGAAVGAARSAASRRRAMSPVRHWNGACVNRSSSIAAIFARGTSRCRRWAGWLRCSARWRRAARS